MGGNTKTLYLDKWFDTEAQFCRLFPLHIQQLGSVHWTPLSVAYKAMRFLKSKPGDRILDIGSGIGKFCLAGAYFKPKAFYFGIEQRKSLVTHANEAKKILGFENVKFIHGNITQIELRDFNHFYFFNSFGENLADASKIDESITYSAELYYYYSNYLRNGLDRMPYGTKFVNYCSQDDEVPLTYQLVNTQYEGRLKFWIKQ